MGVILSVSDPRLNHLLNTNHLIDQFIDAEQFIVIGHRGAAGLAAENTLASFTAALAWQCPMVELDVQLSTDQQGQQNLIVIHDDKLDRTTNGRGPVSDFRTEQVRALDAGGGQQIPLLAEVLQLLRTHRDNTGITVAVNIELKGAQTAAQTAQFLTKWGPWPTLVSSFNHAELRAFKALDRDTPVAPLYDRYTRKWPDTAAELDAYAVNISARAANRERIGAIRRAGYRVFIYTVNTLKEAEILRDLGANGVFTDRPDNLATLNETA